MVLYRRNRVSGGTYFFTVTLADRGSTTLIDHIDELRHAVRATAEERPFRIDAMVILPEHLHALWTLPEADADYSGRWRRLKGLFTRAVVPRLKGRVQNPNGEWNLWQQRFWEHTIRDDLDFRRHADYIHFNPVKHHLVRRVRDWPHSTFHRFVANGIYAEDWGGGEANSLEGGFGE
jgi:putative transposase